MAAVVGSKINYSGDSKEARLASAKASTSGVDLGESIPSIGSGHDYFDHDGLRQEGQ